MRVFSEHPVHYLCLLLFLLLRTLSCHASFSSEALGLEFNQMHDEEQGPIQVGRGARDGVDENFPHRKRVQDGVDKDSILGRREQDGADEVYPHRERVQHDVDENSLHGRREKNGADEVYPHRKRVQHDVDKDSILGRREQDGTDEVYPHRERVQLDVDKNSLHGRRVQEDVDEHLLHEMLKRESHLNGLQGDFNVHSGRVDFPCPEAIDIEPCICSVDVDENIDLDCSDVTSEEQLAVIFQKEFPIKALRYFNMTENSYIRLLDNILNGVTFQKMYLYPGPFALTAISEYFFLNCRETLDDVQIFNTNLMSPFFPFATFEAMEKLNYVKISGNSFTYIPKIIAPTISQLILYYGLVEVVESGTFPIREGPVLIYLYNHLIHTVEPGSFYFADDNSSASNGDLRISLRTNKLRSVRAGTFPIRNGLTYIYVDRNQIEVIEPGTFMLPGDTSQLRLYLYLSQNQLTDFSEEVFGELMPNTIGVELYANPLACDCALAWIITNPEYLAKIDAAAACADGTKLVDLDPAYYIDLC